MQELGTTGIPGNQLPGKGRLDGFDVPAFVVHLQDLLEEHTDVRVFLSELVMAFVIAVPELMSKAFEIGSITFEYLSVYTLTAVIYGSLTLVFLGLVRLLELRLGRHLLRN